jgi:hypothetical protein
MLISDHPLNSGRDQRLVRAAAHGVRDLAAQQPDRRQPPAQVGARLVEQRARGQRRLVAAARALALPAAAQLLVEHQATFAVVTR